MPLIGADAARHSYVIQFAINSQSIDLNSVQLNTKLRHDSLWLLITETRGCYIGIFMLLLVTCISDRFPSFVDYCLLFISNASRPFGDGEGKHCFVLFMAFARPFFLTPQ